LCDAGEDMVSESTHEAEEANPRQDVARCETISSR